MQKKKMKEIEFYKSPKEGVENSLLEPIENILVAHHREIEFSRVKMENIYKEVSIIAEQNDLQIAFLKEKTFTHERLLVTYDVLDMMFAMCLLEKSIVQN